MMVCPRCGRSYSAKKAFCPQDGARLSDRLDPDALDDSDGVGRSGLMAGRYALGALIGHGSMARVYTARDVATDQDVAVKVLSRKYAESDAEQRRFFREARATLQIRHPNVIKLLDVGRRSDGRPYLVIEYLHGETLGEAVRRRKRLPLEIALPILRDAALGLTAVHEAGIVHRDVKPDNIFLVGEPDAPEGVRLVDFGLAKLHAHGAKSSQTATAMGTAAYMPPEQVLSEKVDARADIYSLGVVMFRTISGQLPFESVNDLDMLAHQILLPTPPPSWFLDDLDPKVDALVACALRKHPDNRFATMAAFADGIASLIDGTGSSLTLPRLVVDPDIYQPTTEMGRLATLVFCKTLGVPPPWRPSTPPKGS